MKNQRIPLIFFIYYLIGNEVFFIQVDFYIFYSKIFLKDKSDLIKYIFDGSVPGQYQSLMIQQVKFGTLGLLLLLLSIDCTAVPSLKGHVMPLYGNLSLGYYYTYLYMGTPPQQQSVIVDTGSDQLAVTCTLCTSCSDKYLNPYFNVQQSSTSKIPVCPENRKNGSRCPLFVEYGDGSTISGLFISDYVQFQPHSVGEGFSMPFGCIFEKTNFISESETNGIWGLSPSWRDLTFFAHKQKHKKYTNEQSVLSVCLGRNGGQMIIGGVDSQMIKEIEPVNATFNVSNFGGFYYSLNEVGNIRIGEVTIRNTEHLGPFGMFIDSGSTITSFGLREYQILNKEITQICTRNFDRCSVAPSVQDLSCFWIYLGFAESIQSVVSGIFPNMEIEIGGKIVSWPPERYFIIRKEYDGFTCLGVRPRKDRFILGANWMVNRNIVFSLDHRTIQIYSNVKCSESDEGIAEGMIGGVDIKASRANFQLKIVVFTLLYLAFSWRIYNIYRSQRRIKQYRRSSGNIMMRQLQENVAVQD